MTFDNVCSPNCLLSGFQKGICYQPSIKLIHDWWKDKSGLLWSEPTVELLTTLTSLSCLVSMWWHHLNYDYGKKTSQLSLTEKMSNCAASAVVRCRQLWSAVDALGIGHSSPTTIPGQKQPEKMEGLNLLENHLQHLTGFCCLPRWMPDQRHQDVICSQGVYYLLLVT